MTEDWHQQLAEARTPTTPAQDAWDAEWTPVNEQGLRAGMSPGRAALRALRLTEARHGTRPTKETTK